jgi:hypothetical protein
MLRLNCISQANISSIIFRLTISALRALHRGLLRRNGWHCIACRLGVPVTEDTLVAFIARAGCRELTWSVVVERAILAFLALALEVELTKFARLGYDCSLG